MIFSRISETLFSVVRRFSTSQSSTAPYISPGMSAPEGSSHFFDFSAYGHKNNFRPSSSLQDLSTYRQLDLEQAGHNTESDRFVTHAKPPHPLLRETGASSFSKERMLPGTQFFQRKWVRTIMCLFCLLLFPFFIYVFLNFNWPQKTSKFYVILDCGSTGTRVYIYKASVNHNNDRVLPITLNSFPEGLRRSSGSQSGRAYNRMETEPGLDKLVHNVSGLKATIQPLLRWSEKQIPKKAHKITSLFLCATAGVRKLPHSDSDWLLNNTWLILKTSPFSCQRDWVKTISGVEEAYYGWIALNYHKSMLGTIPRKETFGALDLGGSSLQVTFESSNLVRNETSLSLNIGAVNHHLSAYSLPGYGLNDAFDKSVVSLVKSHKKITIENLNSGNIELKHPCLQSGYKEKYTCSQCSSINQENGSPLTGGIDSSNGRKPGISLRLVGGSKWEECSALAKVAVNLSEWSDLNRGIDCELQPCALGGSLPRPYGEFYAMSGFFVVYRFFNLTSESTLDDLLEKGREFCEKTWKVAKLSVPPQAFIEQYCFRAPYVVFLLREGLHITDGHVTIGSGSVTWTFGFALLQAGNAFPYRIGIYNYEIFQMKNNPMILYVILFISLLLLVCASCVGNCMPRFFLRPYLSLFGNRSASTTSVLRLKRWSPINSGVKLPLSPTVAGNSHRPFDTGHGFHSRNMQLIESSSLYASTSGVSHSYSSGSLGQMQFESNIHNNMGSFWAPQRGNMRLQSRRSQSREDLNSSLAEFHATKI